MDTSARFIPLVAALSILDACSAVIVDDSYVTFPNLIEEDDRETPGEVLRLGMGDPNDDATTERFVEADNQRVVIDDQGRLVLINTMKQTTKVMPLYAQPVDLTVRKAN